MKQRFRTALFILIAACMLFRPQLITAAAGLKAPQGAVSANSKANLTITSIDVGKGDCILVETHDGTVMIDTGYENTSDRVLSWLTEHGSKRSTFRTAFTASDMQFLQAAD